MLQKPIRTRAGLIKLDTYILYCIDIIVRKKNTKIKYAIIVLVCLHLFTAYKKSKQT